MSRDIPEPMATECLRAERPRDRAAARRNEIRQLVGTVRFEPPAAGRSDGGPEPAGSSSGPSARASAPRRRPEAAAFDPSPPVDPLTTIVGLLGTASPLLGRSAGRASIDRLASLLARTLTGVLDETLRALRLRIGGLAHSAVAAQTAKRRLQDLALALRPDPDHMLADAARALTAGELLAILHRSCELRERGSLDALRCRNLVFGSGDAMAREAALDMTSDGIGARSLARIEAVVAHHVRDAVLGVFGPDDPVVAILENALASSPADPAERGSRIAAETGAAARERRFGQCLADGDVANAAALLADGSGLERACVDDAIARRDAKALVGLVWRAGFHPALATSVQIVLGRIPPHEVADRAVEDGFPFRCHEMEWASAGSRN